MIDEIVLNAILTTLKLASITTIILLLIGTPIAWWLAHKNSWFVRVVEVIVALPLVLPPTVIGFYLLIVFSPQSIVGSFWETVFGYQVAFSFTALVIGSVIYSLPFVVQPLQNSFKNMDRQQVLTAQLFGAGLFDRFFNTIIPMCRNGFVTAATLGFAHTVGEFGVILMIGGNIPGETQVLSILLYDQVEMMHYTQAHFLAAGLLLFSFFVLFFVYGIDRSKQYITGGTRVIT